MSIDIINAKKQFKKYIQNYNPEDEQIKIKITHIERVAINSRKIAEGLKLNSEDIELAELIGLLHDIGRFEQIRIYHTFLDKDSINHGELGVHILFEQGLIRKFVQDNKYDSIIKTAILNHNKAKIEENLTEQELLHSKIIRDADKTDIYYVLRDGDIKAIWGKEDFSDDKISDKIYQQFLEDKVLNYKDVKTSADLLLCYFAYVYDLNFKEAIKIIKDNKYIDQLYERFTFKDKETSERYNKVYKEAKKYLEEKG